MSDQVWMPAEPPPPALIRVDVQVRRPDKADPEILWGFFNPALGSWFILLQPQALVYKSLPEGYQVLSWRRQVRRPSYQSTRQKGKS